VNKGKDARECSGVRREEKDQCMHTNKRKKGRGEGRRQTYHLVASGLLGKQNLGYLN